MQVYDLNHDVLNAILGWVAQIDMLHLAETCRQAYDVFMPRFISKVTFHSGPAEKTKSLSLPSIPSPSYWIPFSVALLAQGSPRNSALQVAHFCTFVLRVNEERRRSSWMKELTILYDVFDSKWCNSYSLHLLSDVLIRAVNLTKLTICDVEDLVQLHKPLASVLAAMPLLSDITFSGVRSRMLGVLSKMTSHPRRLQLQCCLGPTEQFLQRFNESLEVLCLCQISEHLLNMLFASEWKSVRELSLSLCAVDLDLVSRAFSHVRVVSLGPNMFYLFPKNLVHWKTLDRLVLPSLREIHPLGPVRRVDVLSCLDYLEGSDTKDPVTLLTQLSPVVFCCHVWRSSLSFYPVLAKTLHSLRYLDLTIKTGGKQYWDNVDGPSEEKLLEHVRAHVDRVRSCGFALTGMRIRDCERVTADVLLRMALYASRILISLKYIGVGGISTNGATWYRVRSHDGEQPVLEALPARDAVKVERELLDTQRS